jgi:hypothetical protein
MNKVVALLVLLTIITGCKKEEVSQSIVPDLAGEWKFVSIFSTTQSFRCYECDGFNYATADPSFYINTNTSAAMSIEGLLFRGYVEGNIESREKNNLSGKIKVYLNDSSFFVPSFDQLSFNNKMILEEFSKVISFNLLRDIGSGNYDFIELHSYAHVMIFAKQK